MWKTERENAIRVCVRVRPLNKKERQTSKDIADVSMKHNTITIKDPKDDQFDPVDVLHRSYEKHFAFQKVFDTTCDQSRIHQETTSGLAEFVCRGNHASVFAYGATGSGKTYTMLGDRKGNPGVILRVLNDLFRYIGNKSVQMSYMEIYNETIRDLLVRRSKILPLRAAGRGIVEVAGLTKTRVRTLSNAMHLLAEGNARRRTEGTAANAVSSRSHAILTIRIGPKAKLNFIDLAGSERASQTQNRNTRLREGARINRSLLSLANCINAIIANQKHRKKRHVPYRDSKLTRVLRDSLSKNGCRTIMIATVRPHRESFRDTLNTLKYASRASSIRKSVARKAIAASRRRVTFPEIVSVIQQQQKSIAVPKRAVMRRQSRDSGRDETSFEDSMGSLFCKTPAPPSMSPTRRRSSSSSNMKFASVDRRASRVLRFEEKSRGNDEKRNGGDDDKTVHRRVVVARRVVELSDSQIVVNRAELIAMRDRIDAILKRNRL